MHFCYKLILIYIYKFFCIAPISCSYVICSIWYLTVLYSTLWCIILTEINNFSLRWSCRNLVIIFTWNIRHILLNWSQNWHIELLRLIIYLFHKVSSCCRSYLLLVSNFEINVWTLAVLTTSRYYLIAIIILIIHVCYFLNILLHHSNR